MYNPLPHPDKFLADGDVIPLGDREIRNHLDPRPCARPLRSLSA